jgi:flagellar hook assembly protein FlgD
LILSTKGITFEVTENVPTTFSLSQNYPNPFNPMTTIDYSLPEQSQVTLEVFNVLGQRVKTLADMVQPAGRHRIVWDGKDDQGKDVASGIYFYRLEAGEFTDSKRMVILK